MACSCSSCTARGAATHPRKPRQHTLPTRLKRLHAGAAGRVDRLFSAANSKSSQQGWWVGAGSQGELEPAASFCDTAFHCPFTAPFTAFLRSLLSSACVRPCTAFYIERTGGCSAARIDATSRETAVSPPSTGRRKEEKVGECIGGLEEEEKRGGGDGQRGHRLLQRGNDRRNLWRKWKGGEGGGKALEAWMRKRRGRGGRGRRAVGAPAAAAWQ